MFDLTSSPNKGRIFQVAFNIDSQTSTVSYQEGHLVNEELTDIANRYVHLDRANTLKLLQIIKKSVNMEDIFQQTEIFLSSILINQGEK